jgi:hypothetical protein
MRQGMPQMIAAGYHVGTAAGANWGRGCVVARTGAGAYTVTLDQLVDATESCVLVQTGTIDTTTSVAHTSDTVKTIGTNVQGAGAGAATDSEIWVLILQVAWGTK